MQQVQFHERAAVRVLIGCEFSGIVRDAFIAAGHDAMSCDLLPTEREGPHHQGALQDVLNDGWDLAIFHPPCTYLAVSGLHWNKRVEGRAEKTEEALAFVQMLMNAPIGKIALENPVSCISSRIRKPDQIIQPWWFGEDASKKTCLWLKGLPHLQKTSIAPPKNWWVTQFEEGAAGHGSFKKVDGVGFRTDVKPAPKMVWSNQTPSGQNKLGPSENRWKERSRTYQGIANAMAKQWGSE